MFKAIVESARKFKRAVTGGGEPQLSPEAAEIGAAIAQAFVAGRFGDVHALGTTAFRDRNPLPEFSSRWREGAGERGSLTGFEVASVGDIDLGFIPGLEDVPQDQLVAFVEIAFSTPELPLDDPKAFVVGVVLLDEAGAIRIGALHKR